jgi:hypothetical protein
MKPKIGKRIFAVSVAGGPDCTPSALSRWAKVELGGLHILISCMAKASAPALPGSSATSSSEIRVLTAECRNLRAGSLQRDFVFAKYTNSYLITQRAMDKCINASIRLITNMDHTNKFVTHQRRVGQDRYSV